MKFAMPTDNTMEKAKPSWTRWTSMVLYVAMVTAMYFLSTPETAGPALTERQERDFRVAAFLLKPARNDSKFAGYTLSYVKSGKLDLSAVSFLLPNGPIDIAQGDIHEVSVLERHTDRQLVEYRFGNTHSSVSRYRAFKDRIEPVSYRVTMHIGIFLWALMLLIPAWLLGFLVNSAWSRIAPGR